MIVTAIIPARDEEACIGAAVTAGISMGADILMTEVAVLTSALTSCPSVLLTLPSLPTPDLQEPICFQLFRHSTNYCTRSQPPSLKKLAT